MYNMQNLAEIPSNFFVVCIKFAFHLGDCWNLRCVRFTLTFVNLFVEVSQVCAAAAAADKLTTSVQVVKEHKKVNVDNVSN